MAVTRTPGAILKQAREGKNLSIAAIATQLNLDLRTIEALERGDLAKLPAPIFVRGYLRGYARLVDVREAAVLDAYQAQAPQEPTPRAIGMAASSMRPAFRVPVIPWRGLLTVALLIVLVALGLEFGPRLATRFLEGAVRDATPDTASSPALTLPVPEAADALVYGVPAADAPESGELDLALPEASSSAPASVEESLSSPMPELPEPSTPSDTDFGAAVEGAAIPTPAATQPEPLPAPPAGQVQLELRFTDASWVEVYAADRTRLLLGLMNKGETRSVSGKAPLSVLLGNAAGVEVRVGGEVFDHTGYDRDNIARFKVGG